MLTGELPAGSRQKAEGLLFTVFPVLGVWKDRLIVDFNGDSRAVGKSAVYHNLYPKQAVLEAEAPLRIKTYKVDMQARSLGWLMDVQQYRRLTDLANFRRLVAIRGEIMVQGWGESGDALAGLPLEVRAGKAEIPKGLGGCFEATGSPQWQ